MTLSSGVEYSAADKVLKLMGDVTKVALRRDDIAGRYGGEEFCILLCDCSREESQRFDTRIRAQLSNWSKAKAQGRNQTVVADC